jgi:hypothetical protein
MKCNSLNKKLRIQATTFTEILGKFNKHPSRRIVNLLFFSINYNQNIRHMLANYAINCCKEEGASSGQDHA